MHGKARKLISCIATGVFAAVLAVGAAGADRAEAGNRTNTGAPGSVSVSSIKNFGGGDIVSDYQGAYFYILPYTDAVTQPAVFIGTYAKTALKKSGGKAYMDYRTLLADNKNYDNYSAFSTGILTWTNQYIMARQIGYTDVPPQTEQALLFVPYSTYSGTSLKEGWKNNISGICYYDESEGATPENAYHVETGSKYLKNRVFAPAYNDSDFDKLCKSGVFYKDLADATKNPNDKEVKPEDDLDVEKMSTVI